jgi:hypothetical protein
MNGDERRSLSNPGDELVVLGASLVTAVCATSRRVK